MAVVQTLIGNIKGPAGATGPQGATGAAGAAATINVGTVSTTAYGNPAQVTNSGTESAAVFDFVIPQGQPGEEVTDMSGLVLGTMTTQTGQFPTPAVNDTGAALWGKVVKYFSDLRTLIGTKLASANVVNNLTTTESGYALDARQGKAISDNMTPTLGSFTKVHQNITLNSGSYLYKQSHMVVFYLRFTTDAAISGANTNLVSFEEDFYANVSTPILIFDNSSKTIVGMVSFGRNGKVFIFGSTALTSGHDFIAYGTLATLT